MFKQNTIDGKCYSAPSANCKKYHIDIFDGAQLNFDPRLNSIFQQNFKRLFNTKEFVPHKKLEIHTDFMDEQCSIRCDPKFSGKPWNDTVSACVENTERRYKKEYPYAVTYGIESVILRRKPSICISSLVRCGIWALHHEERLVQKQIQGLHDTKYAILATPRSSMQIWNHQLHAHSEILLVAKRFWQSK